MSYTGQTGLWEHTLYILCVCVCVAERQNHARELVKEADLSQWDALVIMSGDGLLFEVKRDIRPLSSYPSTHTHTHTHTHTLTHTHPDTYFNNTSVITTIKKICFMLLCIKMSTCVRQIKYLFTPDKHTCVCPPDKSVFSVCVSGD